MRTTREPRNVCLLIAGSTLLGLAACTASIGEPSGSQENPPASGQGGAGGRTGKGGSGGGAPPMTGGPTVTPSACSPAPRARVWRLTGAQYTNTVSQLFGIKLSKDQFPLDTVRDDGLFAFDTNSEEARVKSQLATLYRDRAVGMAETLLPRAQQDHACLAVKAVPAGCAEAFVSAYASKAFRRPLEKAEIDRWTTFFRETAGQHGSTVATRMVLEGVLQSPNFLYRTELGAPGGKGKVQLTQHELASQLSYLLADAPPSPELLKAASDGKLSDRANVRRFAEQLVTSPGSRAKLRNFFEQMLHLKGLADGSLDKDAAVYKDFASIAPAMLSETQTFIDKVIFEEKGGLATLFSANFSYVNKAMATFYGLPEAATAGTSPVRTNLPPTRAGLLGQAGLLSAISSSTSTSPTHRGLFFSQALLCQTVPGPPPDAAAMGSVLLKPGDTNTQREHWDYAKTNVPACSACHATFIPLGLSLEQFDAAGRHRETEFGKAIDTRVELTGHGNADGVYRDGIELGQKIVGSDAGRSCFVRQLMTYGFGRGVDMNTDKCEVEALSKAFATQDLSITGLLVELTQQDSFYFRRFE